MRDAVRKDSPDPVGPRATDPDLFLLYRSAVEQLIDQVREEIQRHVGYFDAGGFYCEACHLYDDHWDDCHVHALQVAMDHVIGIRQEIEDEEKEQDLARRRTQDNATDSRTAATTESHS